MESSLLACPICTQPGFLSVDSLCHGLIFASTREFLCPVCNDVLRGLDKFTIHLFSHSVLRGYHVKGVQSTSSENEPSELSSKVAEPLTLNLKKPSVICDSFADFHASTPYQEDTLQNKTEKSSVMAGNLNSLIAEHISRVSDAPVVFNDKICVDRLEIKCPSGNLENVKEDNCVITGNSKEIATEDFGESDTSSPIPQDIYRLLPSAAESVNVAEIDLTHGSDDVLRSKERSSIAILDGLKSSGHCNNGSAVCEICQFSFTEDTILEMHKQLIHSDSNFRSSNKVADSDIAEVSNGRNYPCLLCTKSFRMRGSLMVHVRVAHNGFPAGRLEALNRCEQSVQDDRSYTCNICDKSFKKESHLAQHIKTHDGKQWACDVCSKLFTTKYFLKKHKRLHTGEMPYRCGICDKTFTFQQSYHKHLLYHSDEKPHVCSQCDRAFKELSTLHNHQRIHTGEKPFACETCGKCFRQRVSYLVHRRIHTGVMPYKCTACGKSFRYKVSQRTHKCPSQPPGTVVRQSSDLVQKLRQAVEVKPQQEEHTAPNVPLTVDVNRGCSVQEKHDSLHEESQLLEKHQENEYVVLTNNHINSSLSQDILLPPSPVLWITGEVEKSQTNETGPELFHVPQIVYLSGKQLQRNKKDCNDVTAAANYQLKDSVNSKTINNEMFYEGLCKVENNTNLMDKNKDGHIITAKILNTKIDDRHSTSQNRGMFCSSSESSAILNTGTSSLAQCEDCKNPGVLHEHNRLFTMNLPVVFDSNAESLHFPHNKPNLSTDSISEKSDLGRKPAVWGVSTYDAAVSQTKFTRETDAGFLEPTKYSLHPQQMLMLNEESLNLFYDADI